ncbi:16S rRNA (guanine(966)-N(2))-methyltransferase RsmD [Pseudodesulfovibrio sp.]|uniref:16S rRNA (guanine(966)-N(2))-methyltransferase RsmD n=1 Tax=unclassified Pseudodesulfovibrio TaxID=2661612 RepID=UPI003B00E43E
MRVVGGELKGRTIKTCEGPGYRPATMKVRESVFSMLQARGVDFDSARVIDLFAGSGSLGIECLSRGVPEAWFVEKANKAAALIRENLKTLSVDRKRFRVVPKDLFSVLNTPPQAPFDLLFIDPPYGKGLLAPALELALNKGWAAEGGLIVAEVETSVRPPEEGPLSELELLTDREYGQTRIIVWRN